MVQTLEARFETSVRPQDSLPNGVFKRWMNVGHMGLAPYNVKVLDEKVIWSSSDGNTVQIRQFIKGWHESPLARNWKRHWGWQMEESIREEIRYRVMIDGEEEVRIREVDVSQKEYKFS